MSARSYDESLVALRRALAFGINPSLDGVTELCEELGRPQDAFSVVQITGTNGKTSTARMTHALLRAEGLVAGLYTSPELERYPERMQVGEAPVTDEQFAEAVSAALDAAEMLRPGTLGETAGFTEFELLTAACLWLFRELGVQIAVLEVGLGGRWDATSVATPAVAVITGVGLDHTGILGDTLGAIASEKAAIIRPGAIPVLGPGTRGRDAVFLARAGVMGTQARAVREITTETPVAEALTVRYELLAHPAAPEGSSIVTVRGVEAGYGSLAVNAPSYQAANVATAIAAAEAAIGRALDATAARQTLRALALPGRFEIVARNPFVVVDGSHNPQAAGVLAGAIDEAWPVAAARPTILLGVLADKDARGIVAALTATACRFAVTAPDSPRALAATTLEAVVIEATGVEPLVFGDLASAIDALASAGDLVVTGSLTTAGQARKLIRESMR
ncbi:MAG TPA: Mur ligase family protein [Coriobacteriia bacterium]|nr:Mur ligase family protein [Coriobacteriia bacterium]